MAVRQTAASWFLAAALAASATIVLGRSLRQGGTKVCSLHAGVGKRLQEAAGSLSSLRYTLACRRRPTTPLSSLLQAGVWSGEPEPMKSEYAQHGRGGGGVGVGWGGGGGRDKVEQRQGGSCYWPASLCWPDCWTEQLLCLLTPNSHPDLASSSKCTNLSLGQPPLPGATRRLRAGCGVPGGRASQPGRLCGAAAQPGRPHHRPGERHCRLGGGG